MNRDARPNVGTDLTRVKVNLSVSRNTAVYPVKTSNKYRARGTTIKMFEESRKILLVEDNPVDTLMYSQDAFR